MRLFILVCCLMFAASLSFVSTAQDETVASKKAQAQSSENKPSGENSKTRQNTDGEKSETQQAETEGESFDLDSFFKQGEENAKNGSSCTKPPDPIV